MDRAFPLSVTERQLMAMGLTILVAEDRDALRCGRCPAGNRWPAKVRASIRECLRIAFEVGRTLERGEEVRLTPTRLGVLRDGLARLAHSIAPDLRGSSVEAAETAAAMIDGIVRLSARLATIDPFDVAGTA